MSRSQPRQRSDFRFFTPVTTRWMDNDVYGHINNVTYYSFFDTVVNRYLIEAGVLDVERSDVIGLVVQTACEYFSPISFPEEVEAAIYVAHIGKSSVRYEVGVFKQGEILSAAHGHFVHVYVDKASRRPAPLTTELRQALQALSPE